MNDEQFQASMTLVNRAGDRAVDLEGPRIYQESKNLKLKTKAAIFKRVSLLIGGGVGPP